MKAGAQMSNAEKWMLKAEEYKQKAADLAVQLIEVTKERNELQDTLDHIADLAGPDRVMDSERLERVTRMCEMLMNRMGFAPSEIPRETQGEEDDEPATNNGEDDDGEEGEEESEEEEAARSV